MSSNESLKRESSLNFTWRYVYDHVFSTLRFGSREVSCGCKNLLKVFLRVSCPIKIKPQTIGSLFR